MLQRHFYGPMTVCSHDGLALGALWPINSHKGKEKAFSVVILKGSSTGTNIKCSWCYIKIHLFTQTFEMILY